MPQRKLSTNRTDEQLKADRGKKVTITQGKYKGFEAWMDKKPGGGTLLAWIIVNQSQVVDELLLTATHTKKDFVEDAPDESKSPTSMAEAVVRSVPKIDSLMWKLCRELAKCQLRDEDTSGVEEIFHQRLSISMREFKKIKGEKLIHVVEYDPDEIVIDEQVGHHYMSTA